MLKDYIVCECGKLFTTQETYTKHVTQNATKAIRLSNRYGTPKFCSANYYSGVSLPHDIMEMLDDFRTAHGVTHWSRSKAARFLLRKGLETCRFEINNGKKETVKVVNE